MRLFLVRCVFCNKLRNLKEWPSADEIFHQVRDEDHPTWVFVCWHGIRNSKGIVPYPFDAYEVSYDKEGHFECKQIVK